MSLFETSPNRSKPLNSILRVLTALTAAGILLGGVAVGPVVADEGSTPQTIRVGQGPTDVARSPNGNKMYVSNTTDGTVSVIDTTSNSVTATIKVGDDPAMMSRCRRTEAHCM